MVHAGKYTIHGSYGVYKLYLFLLGCGTPHHQKTAPITRSIPPTMFWHVSMRVVHVEDCWAQLLQNAAESAEKPHQFETVPNSNLQPSKTKKSSSLTKIDWHSPRTPEKSNPLKIVWGLTIHYQNLSINHHQSMLAFPSHSKGSQPPDHVLIGRRPCSSGVVGSTFHFPVSCQSSWQKTWGGF